LKIFDCDKDDLADVGNIVRKGGLVVFPTDTLYGLGCDPRNRFAVRKIFSLKKRTNKPLPVLCSSIDDVVKLIDLGELGRLIAKRYWPGKITIISELVTEDLPEELTAGRKRLGVRIPNHNCALKLIKESGGSLIGTSANISGYPPPESFEEIVKLFGEVDAIIECKESHSGIQSTVIEIMGESFKIIREGEVTADNLYQTTFI
jgi:L-threonylcarbamoyladenylate synthase